MKLSSSYFFWFEIIFFIIYRIGLFFHLSKIKLLEFYFTGLWKYSNRTLISRAIFFFLGREIVASCLIALPFKIWPKAAGFEFNYILHTMADRLKLNKNEILDLVFGFDEYKENNPSNYYILGQKLKEKFLTIPGEVFWNNLTENLDKEKNKNHFSWLEKK